MSQKTPPIWVPALQQVANAEIKEKVIRERAELKVQSFEGNGVEKIRSALLKIPKAAPGVTIHYIGAPKYYADFIVKDPKDVDKTIAKVEKSLATESGIEFSVQKIKG